MKTRTPIIVWSIIIVLMVGIGFSTIPPAKATFVLADAWEYPNDNGHGIVGFFFLENSSGAWWTVPGAMIQPSNNSIFEFTSGFSLGLDVRLAVNYTFLGLDAPDPVNFTAEEQPGLNYIRLSVLVTTSNGTLFSQQNATYDELGGEIGNGVWWYSQEFYFDFILTIGGIYAIELTYEVYEVIDL